MRKTVKRGSACLVLLCRTDFVSQPCPRESGAPTMSIFSLILLPLFHPYYANSVSHLAPPHGFAYRGSIAWSLSIPGISPWELFSPGSELISNIVALNLMDWYLKLLLLLSRFSRVRLLVTPWTAAYQAPPSMGFSRQKYWSALPLPSPIWNWEADNSVVSC